MKRIWLIILESEAWLRVEYLDNDGFSFSVEYKKPVTAFVGELFDQDRLDHVQGELVTTFYWLGSWLVWI
jgi:hypothetical protein